jgi:hypothetical protein
MQFMTTYSAGTIVVTQAFSTSGQPGKMRPYLVMFDSGDADITLAKLTSAAPRGAFDVTLTDWALAGLRLRTVVRVDKLITIEKAQLRQTMGTLTVRDHSAVGAVLKQMFGNW